jgi:hypothetical protein
MTEKFPVPYVASAAASSLATALSVVRTARPYASFIQPLLWPAVSGSGKWTNSTFGFALWRCRTMSSTVRSLDQRPNQPPGACE